MVEDDKVFNIYNFHNGYSETQKINNWQYLAKILKHKKVLKKFGPFELTESEYKPIISQAPDAAYNFLIKFYEFLTKRKLNDQ